jgi:hypothetical protein
MPGIEPGSIPGRPFEHSCRRTVRTFLNHFLEKDLEKYQVTDERIAVPSEKAA